MKKQNLPAVLLLNELVLHDQLKGLNPIVLFDALAGLLDGTCWGNALAAKYRSELRTDVDMGYWTGEIYLKIGTDKVASVVLKDGIARGPVVYLYEDEDIPAYLSSGALPMDLTDNTGRLIMTGKNWYDFTCRDDVIKPFQDRFGDGMLKSNGELIFWHPCDPRHLVTSMHSCNRHRLAYHKGKIGILTEIEVESDSDESPADDPECRSLQAAIKSHEAGLRELAIRFQDSEFFMSLSENDPGYQELLICSFTPLSGSDSLTFDPHGPQKVCMAELVHAMLDMVDAIATQ